MRHVVAVALSGLLLGACSSSASPGDVRRDAVKSVVDAANAGVPQQLRSAAEQLLATLSQQLKAGTLAPPDYAALRTYALRIRAEAGLLTASPPPTTTRPPAPRPTSALPTTAPATQAPAPTAPSAVPTTQPPIPVRPTPTATPSKGKGKGGGKKGGGSSSPSPVVPGPVPESALPTGTAAAGGGQ